MPRDSFALMILSLNKFDLVGVLFIKGIKIPFFHKSGLSHLTGHLPEFAKNELLPVPILRLIFLKIKMFHQHLKIPDEHPVVTYDCSLLQNGAKRRDLMKS